MNSANPTFSSGIRSNPLAQLEADLRTEAAAIEKFRKQINDAGANVSRTMMADFAKQQKAYLDRKIEFEKQKRALGKSSPAAAPIRAMVETPAPAAVPAPAATPEPVIAKSSAPVATPAPQSPTTLRPAEVSTSPVRKSAGRIRMIWGVLAIASAAIVWLTMH